MLGWKQEKIVILQNPTLWPKTWHFVILRVLFSQNFVALWVSNWFDTLWSTKSSLEIVAFQFMHLSVTHLINTDCSWWIFVVAISGQVTKSCGFIETFSKISRWFGVPWFCDMAHFSGSLLMFGWLWIACWVKLVFVSNLGSLNSWFSKKKSIIIRWYTCEVEHGTWKLTLPVVDSLRKQTTTSFWGFSH